MMKRTLSIAVAVIFCAGAPAIGEGEGKFAVQKAEFLLYRDLGHPPVKGASRCIRLSSRVGIEGVEIVHLILRENGSSIVIADKLIALSNVSSRVARELPIEYGVIIRDAPSASSLAELKDEILNARPAFYSGYIEYAELVENNWVRAECPVTELKGKLAIFEKAFGAFGGAQKAPPEGGSK